MEEDKRLTIPTNIPLRWELFRGFGTSELLKTLLVTAIAIAIDVVFCLLSAAEWKYIVCVVITICVIFVFKRATKIYLQI